MKHAKKPLRTRVLIGAGVTAAYYLGKDGHDVTLLEANVDDATGETLAHAVAALLEAGARHLRPSHLQHLRGSIDSGGLATQLGVTPRLEAIRDLAFGPDGNVEAAAEYRRLHGVSMGIFSAVLLGAIALVPLHARWDPPETDRRT